MLKTESASLLQIGAYLSITATTFLSREDRLIDRFIYPTTLLEASFADQLKQPFCREGIESARGPYYAVRSLFIDNDCGTEDEANELLRVAREHCRGAVEELERAMKLCGL